MSKINEKLGLRAKTKKREATHGVAIVSSARCPNCGNRRVIKCQSKNLVGQYMCGACSTFWRPESEEKG